MAILAILAVVRETLGHETPAMSNPFKSEVMNNFHEIEGPHLPRARVGVFRGQPPQLVAKITIEVFAGGKVQFSVSGDATEAAQIVKYLKHDALPSPEWSSSKTISGALQWVQERLAEPGYQIQDLPLADMEISFQFDAARGIALGRRKSLHEHDQTDSDIHKNIFDALAGIFPKAANALASEVSRLASEDAHQAAADAVRAGRDEGIAFLAPPPALLDALCQIDISSLDDGARLLVCETRLAVAVQLRKFEMVEQDARVLLHDKSWADDAKRASLENVMAIAANARGEVEAALSIWRRLCAEPEKLNPGERAWVWRNISLTLPYDDPEARQAARLSVDAFLEAGDKVEAATSLMQLSSLLEHEGPHAALEQLDAMMQIIDQHGLIGAELLAALHHARGNRLMELRDWKNAMEEAERAIALRRDVLGAEDKLISSLHLASLAAKNMDQPHLSEVFDSEAKKQEEGISSTYYGIARRVAAQFENFDLNAAESLLADARTFGDIGLISAVQVLIATHNPQFTVTQRLGKLEGLLRELKKGKDIEKDTHPVKLAIATVLRDDGQYARAASWLRKILNDRPLDVASRDMLLDCLWKSKDWGGAVKFLKDQIARHGELRGLLYAYGLSLVELGDHSTAVSVLTKALKLADGNDNLRDVIRDLRERALNSGGTIPSVLQDVPAVNYVTRDELEQALQDYAEFVAADKRMMFWARRPDGSDYEWVTRPEKLAQDFLHAFLKARFRNRISVFEELATGAGRLDILLKFEGGLSAVIELKMCGFRYSSAYAASGEEQIHHYMENRSCHLGYLVVHDSRLDHFASALIAAEMDSNNSVREIFVDVRPRVRSGKIALPPG